MHPKSIYVLLVNINIFVSDKCKQNFYWNNLAHALEFNNIIFAHNHYSSAMVHGHNRTWTDQIYMCRHISIEHSYCIVFLLWRRKGHMIYAMQVAKIKSILIFFKFFSVFMCVYCFVNTITKMANSSVQFDRVHAT